MSVSELEFVKKDINGCEVLFCSTKLNDGRTVSMTVWQYWHKMVNYMTLNVELWIGKKKKRSDIEFTNMTVGNHGIEGLVVGLRMLMALEKLIEDNRIDAIIEVCGTDNRRLRVYRRLLRYGYKYDNYRKAYIKKTWEE